MTEDYDLAVSFGEEHRSAVGEVVEACRQRGLTVLAEPEQTHDWWSHKSEGDLPDARIRFFVPFTGELDAFTEALLRATRAGDAHVLPVLGDSTVSADLLHPHVSYLHQNELEAAALAAALANRVETAESAGLERVHLGRVMARARELDQDGQVPIGFSRYAEQDATLRYLGEQLTAAAPGLQDFAATVHRGESRIAFRVERAGDIVYALDIQRGGLGGDETVNFVVGLHDNAAAATSGWARPVYDTASRAAKLELHDRSVFGPGGALAGNCTREELFSALWKRIRAVIAG